MSQASVEERIRRELPHLSDADVRELARVLERLICGLSPERIYLFGSQARGEAGPDSDFDLLVVVPSSELPNYRLSQEAHGIVGRRQVSLDILVMPREEFDSRSRAPSSLPATVLREGMMLYAA